MARPPPEAAPLPAVYVFRYTPRMPAGLTAARVWQAVEELEEELVEFLRDLVRIPTENPPGRNYLECARVIGRMMEEAGCAVEYVQVPPERLAELAPHGEGLPRLSVLGRYPGRRARPCLHLTGHYDVVPVGDGWSVDPYKAELRDGRVYGRGASDQKSGIAAQLFALKALQRCGCRLAGSLVLSATPDEETGGFAGVGYLVAQGLIARDNTDFVVITECLDSDRICLGHRGTLWLELETRGRQSHGSMPSLGVNAIEKMLAVLDRIELEIRPGLNQESVHPVRPPACRRSTLTVTMIQAGSKVNTVPARCTAALDWRLIPEQSVAGAREALESLRDRMRREEPELELDIRELMAVNPTLVPSDTEVVRAFQEAGRAVLGREPGFSVSPGSDDQKFVVQQAGIEQCIVYGPGPLAVAHQADEYQPVADLKQGTAVLALAAARLLGVEEPG
jgi:succinyl-diaminopimelate desuccinylase